MTFEFATGFSTRGRLEISSGGSKKKEISYCFGPYLMEIQINLVK